MVHRGKSRKIDRLIHLVKYIQDNETVTAKTLADRFAVSERTVYQDVRELNAVGIPVYFSSTGFQLLSSFSSPSLFSKEESLLIHIGLIQLQKDGLCNPRQLKSIQAKIFSPHDEFPTGSFGTPAQSQAPVVNVVDFNIITELNEAIVNRIRINMKYRSRNDKKAGTRELSPYIVIFRKDSWYVIGFCHKHDEIRTFKVSRVEHIEFTGQPYIQDDDFDVDEYLMYRWYIYGGEPNVVIVRFDEQVGPLLLEKQVAHGRVWEENGEIYMQTLVSSLEEFSWWIMQYGEHAEVLQPRELRRILAKRCAKMAAVYSKTILQRSRRVKS